MTTRSRARIHTSRTPEGAPMTTDYTGARYYAISGLGYGKGFSPEEAVQNYVATQMRNHKAANTQYKTKAKFEVGLREGEMKAKVWHAPEGTAGFVIDHTGLNWYDDDGKYTPATAGDRVTKED